MGDYDNRELASKVINYSGGDDDNYFRNALIIILKVLEYVEEEIEKYDDEEITRELLGVKHRIFTFYYHISRNLLKEWHQ